MQQIYFQAFVFTFSSKEKQTCWKEKLFSCCNNSCEIHRGTGAVAALLWETQNCRCCLMTQLKFDLGPGDRPRYSFTYLHTKNKKINKHPALFSLQTAISSFHKHFRDLCCIRGAQKHSAIREKLRLPCWQAGHMLYTCETGRAGQPCVHCNTPMDEIRTDTLEKKKPPIFSLISLVSQHMHPWLLFFFYSAFNLAHRWRVLTALHPALSTHTHTHKHPHSRHQ